MDRVKGRRLYVLLNRKGDRTLTHSRLNTCSLMNLPSDICVVFIFQNWEEFLLFYVCFRSSIVPPLVLHCTKLTIMNWLLKKELVPNCKGIFSCQT